MREVTLSILSTITAMVIFVPCLTLVILAGIACLGLLVSFFVWSWDPMIWLWAEGLLITRGVGIFSFVITLILTTSES